MKKRTNAQRRRDDLLFAVAHHEEMAVELERDQPEDWQQKAADRRETAAKLRAQLKINP